MAILPICITGEPVLHEPAAEVIDFDDDLRALIDDMYETMDAAPGVGLAAPQVGVGQRLFVYSYEEDGEAWRGVAVNPTLWIAPLPVGELTEEDEEGCLSFPGERFPLHRSLEALLHAQDGHGEEYTLHVTGWMARILQHEYDHLDGIIYVDRLTEPWSRDTRKIVRRRGWGEPGLSWTPGIDDLEG